MKTTLVGLAALLVAALAPASVKAQEYPADQVAGPEYQDPNVGYAPEQSSFGYFGAHPIPHDQGGGFCNAEGAHDHPYPVFDQHLFRFSNGYAYFVGDPADFGYQSPGYMYAGHHPLDDVHGGGFCYMGWSHRHLFAPIGVGFALQAGAYVYTGGWAPAYYAQRPLYTSYFDGYYRRWYTGGRYYSLRPNPVYVGWGWRRPYSPVYRAPVYGGPVYRPPVYGGPVYRPPVYGGPVYRSPAPVYNAPAYRSPVVSAPPVYRAPVMSAPPVYRAPVVSAPPVYRAPVQAGWGRR